LPERSGALADDPFGGRRPTSHERLTGQPWDASYRDGPAPWDAGYVASLASVTEHDGTLYVLCFSDDGPDTGPHPISQEELRAAFDPGTGWNIAAIEPDRVQTRYHDDNGAPAWFATIKRI